MKNTITVVCALVIGFIAGMLPGCESGIQIVPERAVSIREGSDIEVPAFTWRIRDDKALREAWERGSGTPLPEGGLLEGFTATDEAGRLLIYTKAPRKVDGGETLTLGHEVMHLSLGNYHPEYRSSHE